MVRRIYVLHEYGSDSHYNGLKYLCKKYNVELVFREFRVFHLIGSGVKHKNIKKIVKQPINILFLLSLVLSKGRIVVLGMHPYDKRLPILNFVLRNHIIFYHSSFTAWNPNDMNKYKCTSPAKLQRIKNFVLNHTQHIFAVTNKAKKSICDFTGVDESKVSVVYHSYTQELKMGEIPQKNKYIYVGRMEQGKGIEELCEYFANNKGQEICLIGEGDMLQYVRMMASQHGNIHYEGYVKGLNNLVPYYQKHAFFVLNSKRTKEWEELFGQVLIEAMSCGCIPISVNHSGPKEIIDDGVNGFLFPEGDFAIQMDSARNLDSQRFLKMRNAAFARGHEFESRIIAERWQPIISCFGWDK